MSGHAAFERALYAKVVREVRANVPGVKMREAWVWTAGRDHWEFHYGDFFWQGSASGAYDARAAGWVAYLANKDKVGV